jgi:glyoxylase-like metal-dependent hydrolase (beta-lactamase superfamily II)
VNASNITGGMKQWAAYHRIVRINPQADDFAIYQVVRPAKGCLSYLIVAGGEAIAVDCTRYTDVYHELAEKLGARLSGVVDTHLHADHISGSAGLASETGSAYHLADEDATGGTVRRDSIPKRIDVGSVKVRVLSLPVPGHTLGSTALLIADRYLISGDTLLPDGVGRPDLGNKAHEWTGFLYDSLSDVLGKLDPKTTVLPAHVAAAKQCDERGACVRVLGDLLAAQASADRSAFVARVEELVSRSSQPPEYAEIRRVNLGESKPAERIEELEVGVNKCAV